jgi:peptidoglycan-binding domain 1 protein
MKLKKIISITIALLMCTNISYGHSGRTDSNGGHRDKKNISGLGPYHYHCNGNPAHLHTNGICPYNSSSSKASYSSSSKPSSSSSNQVKSIAKPDPNKNNVYLLHTMPQMTVGQSFTNEAVSNNKSAKLTWSSSNNNVATVDSTGKVTAKGVGTAVITVTNGYKSASYNITCKGYISYTSTKAEINGNPIQLYYYNGDVYVLCNDLNSYGFDSSFTQNSSGSIVKITRNENKTVNPKDIVSYPNNKLAYVVSQTSINVICGTNTSYSKSINGDGRMFVSFDSLAAFGKVTKDQNTVSLTTF